MENQRENIEENIQIKDFNRKIKVNENDLIPIDDIVEETYAITYKNLLEQIKKDIFYEGTEYFKRIIRDIISRELLEYELHVEQMYTKTMSKLIGLKSKSNTITLDDVLNTVKEILIQNTNQSGENINSSKISIYNAQRRDFELIGFQTFTDKLKQIFAEATDFEKLKESIKKITEQVIKDEVTIKKIDISCIKQYELTSKLNTIVSQMSSYTNQNNKLEFIAFNSQNNQLYKLTSGHLYLKGIPDGFKYWGITPTSDLYYSYNEFSNKTLKIDITSDKVELRFPRNLKEQNIYLYIILHLVGDKNPNQIMTKKVYLRFSENSNTSQYTMIYFYSGKQHNQTITLLEGWYKIKSSVYNNDERQDTPHLLKL
ncbi:DUF685 domain-containing protein [Borrelia persica]|uniref:DUF685 domain-containing protein n=1 Tax=Borrelia persica TaxID=44448 RepID=UPI0004633486|nr:DUF685 domain-containing protein [Borrelia persica]